VERFDSGWNGDVLRDVGPGSRFSSIDSTEVRLQLADAGHVTVSDGSGRAPFPCDVGTHLRRTLHDRDAHSSVSMKHTYKLPVVPNIKHNVTEKVAQVCFRNKILVEESRTVADTFKRYARDCDLSE